MVVFVVETYEATLCYTCPAELRRDDGLQRESDSSSQTHRFGSSLDYLEGARATARHDLAPRCRILLHLLSLINHQISTNFTDTQVLQLAKTSTTDTASNRPAETPNFTAEESLWPAAATTIAVHLPSMAGMPVHAHQRAALTRATMIASSICLPASSSYGNKTRRRSECSRKHVSLNRRNRPDEGAFEIKHHGKKPTSDFLASIVAVVVMSSEVRVRSQIVAELAITKIMATH